MLELKDQDFKRLITFIQSRYGINLSQKRQLIMGRLSNVVLSMGYSTFSEYIDNILTQKNPQDIEIMLNKLTTNYTFFMRESEHFDYFRNTVLPYLEKKKTNKVLSIWSAGCSSGQEPYTLSMILKEYFDSKPGSWDTRVLATDISQNALRSAMEGIYDEESMRDLPPDWKRKYFKATKEPGLLQVSDALKKNVIFRTFNLMDPIRFRLKFDVIFCRNVMIYFDQETKDALVQRFFDASVPGAYLFIGHSESLNKATTPYTYLMPAAYRKQ
ncbi:MAG: protein-glutamate O-methyltransferase CheR [Lachnospiraceae bacterium]|nr:protein-glutamate O-methyltransferase CheR [Lachnospiraceae bacterium]